MGTQRDHSEKNRWRSLSLHCTSKCHIDSISPCEQEKIILPVCIHSLALFQPRPQPPSFKRVNKTLFMTSNIKYMNTEVICFALYQNMNGLMVPLFQWLSTGPLVNLTPMMVEKSVSRSPQGRIGFLQQIVPCHRLSYAKLQKVKKKNYYCRF